MIVKAIVLDIGGVLFRTEDYSGRLKIEQQYQLPPGRADELVFNSKQAKASTIGLLESQEVWNNVAKQLHLSKEELDLFRLRFWSGDRMDHETIKYLEQLRPRYITALLSNAWEGFRTVLSQEHGVEEHKTVDYILISSELGVAKPDIKIYQMLADKINCNFNEILFIDDFIENVKSAEKLGIQTFHYQKGMNLINEIKLRLI